MDIEQIFLDIQTRMVQEVSVALPEPLIEWDLNPTYGSYVARAEIRKGMLKLAEYWLLFAD